MEEKGIGHRFYLVGHQPAEGDAAAEEPLLYPRPDTVLEPTSRRSIDLVARVMAAQRQAAALGGRALAGASRVPHY